jgi:hypothetical protein
VKLDLATILLEVIYTKKQIETMQECQGSFAGLPAPMETIIFLTAIGEINNEKAQKQKTICITYTGVHRST